MKWNITNRSFKAGDSVWVRGCRDMPISGIIISISDSAVFVEMCERIQCVSLEDIAYRELKDGAES